MFPNQLADPLGPGVLAGAVSDIQGLVTGTYTPVMVGAILFGTALGIAFRWIRRATRTAGSAK
jgi:hypothetical protein